MLKVYKYDVPIKDSFTLSLPRTGTFLTFQAQRDRPQIWMLVDPDDDRKIDCEFRLAGTGHPIEWPQIDLYYRGTCQMHDGALVWHLFEVPSPNARPGSAPAAPGTPDA
jgi:hypothetical protein